MKRLACSTLCLILLLTILLSGCGSGNGTNGQQGSQETGKEVKTIKIANWYGDDHVVNIVLREKFKPLVEERSNGSLKVDIFSNSQLGGEEQMYDSVRSGAIEIAVLGVIMESEVPKIGLFTLPFLFKDHQHVQRVLNGEVGADIAAELEEKTGLKHLGYGVNGFRVFSSNKDKPLQKIEDFKGYRVRMPNVPQMIAVAKALGATVTPLPVSEIFTALEQGVVDGQDNPYATLRANGWYEVQSYVLESRHIYLPNNIVASKKFWDSLTPDQQKVIQDAMKETIEYEWQLTIENEEKDKKFLQENGITIIVPDEKFRSQMIEATKGIYEEFYKKYPWAEEMVNKIKEQG